MAIPRAEARSKEGLQREYTQYRREAYTRRGSCTRRKRRNEGRGREGCSLRSLTHVTYVCTPRAVLLVRPLNSSRVASLSASRTVYTTTTKAKEAKGLSNGS